MARRLKLEISGGSFDRLLEQFEELGGNVTKLVTEQLTFAAETVADDTVDAMNPSYFPRQGKYSHGGTLKTLVRHPQVIWTGDIAEVGVGFDTSKGGASTFLIFGTPSMRPNYKLEDIYARKKYLKKIIDDISEGITDEITDIMGAKK